MKIKNIKLLDLDICMSEVESEKLWPDANFAIQCQDKCVSERRTDQIGVRVRCSGKTVLGRQKASILTQIVICRLVGIYTSTRAYISPSNYVAIDRI